MADRVRVASLGPQVGSDAAADEQDTLADAPVSAWRNASFDERFARWMIVLLPSRAFRLVR